MSSQPLHREVMRERIAHWLDLPIDALRDDAPLGELLRTSGISADGRGACAEAPLRDEEIALFLLTARLEDDLGIDLAAHPGFDRLLTQPFGNLVDAVASLASRSVEPSLRNDAPS